MLDWTQGELPQPTTDVATLKSNIDEFGYCLLQDALPPETNSPLRDSACWNRRRRSWNWAMPLKMAAPSSNGAPSPMKQAGSSAKAFSAKAGGVNQRVWLLINKGKVFRDMLAQPAMRAVVGHVLGADYLLSSYGANIAKPGGIAMNLHTDQWWMPEPIHRAPQPGTGRFLDARAI